MQRTITPEALKSELDGKFILDVRRAADRGAAPAHLPGAQWRNPEQITEWASSLPKDQEVGCTACAAAAFQTVSWMRYRHKA